MPNNTMTLALTGEIPFDAFAETMANFNALVNALGNELDAKEGVEWFIDSLEHSSTIATIRGESVAPGKVGKVVDGFAKVGRALEKNVSIPFSPNVARHARAIAGVLDAHVTSIRFETAEEDIIISTPPPRLNSVAPAYGAIEGRVQTLTNRFTLRFTLFDVLYDRAVSCYLDERREDLMREAWGKRAIVEGLVTRDPQTGRPLSIRRITNIHLLQETESDYRDARGIAPAPDGVPLPEDIIRQLRDG